MNGLRNTWRLLGKLVDLNRTTYVEFKERRNFQRMPIEYWRRLPELVFDKHEPVFVLSTGRCGTALLTEIFERIPSLLCYHAPSPELVFAERKAYEEGLDKFEAYKTAILVARFELVADCIVRGRRYVETNCRITFFAPHLYELFPRARFVHLVRHPGDFIRSGVRRKYYCGQYDDIGRIRPVAGPVADAWPDMSIYERCAWLWNETNEFIEQFKKERDSRRVVTIKAEDLFSDPEATLKIFEHCGISSPPAADVAKWIKDPVNAQIDETNIPPYSQWVDDLKHQVGYWVPCAHVYGYEL